MKSVTITSKNITQKQWSSLVLELNIMKHQWQHFATLNIDGPGVKKIIKYVNFMGETTRLTLINMIDESIVRMTVPGMVKNKINDIVGLNIDERFVYLF